VYVWHLSNQLWMRCDKDEVAGSSQQSKGLQSSPHTNSSCTGVTQQVRRHHGQTSSSSSSTGNSALSALDQFAQRTTHQWSHAEMLLGAQKSHSCSRASADAFPRHSTGRARVRTDISMQPMQRLTRTHLKHTHTNKCYCPWPAAFLPANTTSLVAHAAT